ncbi:MAG: hypothetical protein ACXADD_15085 [Candidatus Thorarchaeota archaeon]|jgi:hypothetical protein
MGDSDDQPSRVKKVAQEFKDFIEEMQALKRALGPLNPEATDLTFNYLSRSSEVRFAVNAPRGLRRTLSRNIEIPALPGYSIKEIMHLNSGGSVRSGFRKEDDKWKIPVDLLSSDENYLIFLKGKVSQAFLDTFVKVNVPSSPDRDDECDRYWLTATLADIKRIERLYNVFAVDDVTIGVDIGVQRIFSAAMPPRMKERLEAHAELVAISKSKTRDAWIKASRRYIESIRKVGGEPLDFIQLVAELVSGDYFREYIRVDTPRFDIGRIEADSLFITLPEKVLVEAQSRLSKEDPAVEGNLIFDRRKYMNSIDKKVEEAFGKKDKKKKT